MAHAEGRVWGGLTAQERADRRRAQILDAGLELFAAKGWATVTVLDLCRGAGLSQRYFYEHFAGREALLVAVVERIAAEVEETVRAAATTPGRTPTEHVADVLAALADLFAADPRRVRVALVETSATEELRAIRAAYLGRFAALTSRLMASLRPDPQNADERGLEISAFVLTSGVAEALVQASAGEGRWERDELVAHLTALYSAASRL